MNIAQKTEKWISTHPSVKDCLKKNLINYSKLSRLIAGELGIDTESKFEAVLIACRRYQEKLKKGKELEDDILLVLSNSKLEVKNKMVAVVVGKHVHFESLLELQKLVKKKAEVFHIIEGASAITIATNEEFLPHIQDTLKKDILKINNSLVEITLKSPVQLETTPGVMGYLYSLFAEHGINIVETMSCYTDTIFLIEEDDIAAAMKILKFT